MFCRNCACELPAVARFCVKCGARVEWPATHVTSPPLRAIESSCVNCAKPLDPSDMFCNYCGRETVHPQEQVAKVANDIATRNFEKHAERYARMSNSDLVRLSGELNQLTEVAQKALIVEIAKRGLKGSSPIRADANLGGSTEKQSGLTADWDYEKMSDEEIQQLYAAHLKLRQPISESLSNQLALRASRSAQVVSTPSLSTPAVPPVHMAPNAPAATLSAADQVPIGVVSQRNAPPPYARYVVMFLLACTSASVGVFAFFDAFARNTTALILEVLSIVLTLVFGWLGWTTWKHVLSSEPKNEAKSRRRVRNALVTSVIFILLYLGLAALLGSIIGQNRAEATQFSTDATVQKELADRITKARTSVSASIPSYLAMYGSIESDVVKYSSTLAKLREELGKYDAKFPAQRESTHKYVAFVEKEIRRGELLTKQIAVAKQIELLDPEQQRLAWQRDMLPLLDQEDALDKAK
jgi:hypothetical protein